MSYPLVVSTREELREATRGLGTIALVPTMGAFHDGHVQLLHHGRRLGDVLVASVFVNPTQFAPGEDYDAYPRTFDEDMAKCASAGVDVVFFPSVETVYPEGTDKTISVDPGPLGHVLEGRIRPTHFRGVLTVVAKLFGLVRPDVAVFGDKDYQQLVLIRQMAEALCYGIDIVGSPIVREEDGLAMSSRNAYMTPDERNRARALSQAVQAGAEQAPAGADAAIKAARDVLDSVSGIDVDYIALTDAELGAPAPGGEARLLAAARLGTTRLLDNTGLILGDT